MIKYKNGFWIKRRGDTFIAYISLINALLNIQSPSLNTLYTEDNLKYLYFERSFKKW